MIYIVSKIFDLIFCPSALLLLCSVLGGWLTLRRAESLWGRRLLVVGVGGLMAFATLPLGEWMMQPLEERFPPAQLDHVDGIIVLGGAPAVGRSVNRGMPLMGDTADRMTSFVALARRYPQARLIFSGGNSDPFSNGTPEATIAGLFFDDMGLDPTRITFEGASRNTHENAVLSQRLMQPKPGEQWLLVTSAADMPRAVGCFRAAGWPVIAMPTNYKTLHNASRFVPGLLQGLRLADWASHEWIGLVYYRLHGWTPSLFPGPRE